MIRGLGVEFRFETEIRTQQDLERSGAANSIAIFLGVGLGAIASPRHSRRRPPRRDRRAAVHRRLQDRRLRRPSPKAWWSLARATPPSMRPMRHAGSARANVAILYRRSEQHMSAFAFEYEHAKQEGVQFLWRVHARQRIHSRRDTAFARIECAQAAIGDDGVLAAVPGIEFPLRLPADHPAPLGSRRCWSCFQQLPRTSN